MSEPKERGPAWPLGTVTVLGAHILDVLGRPVEEIPPGQGSVRLKEIRATAAGTAAGTGVDLAKLGARVRAVGALGDDLLGDIVIAAMARHGVDTAGLIRKKDAQTSATILPIRPNGERPAFHVPGATRLFTRADVDLDAIHDSRALLIGAPDALAGLTGGDLADIAGAARSNGVLVAVDVLHPGRPEDLDRLAGLLLGPDPFGADPLDAAWLGLACGALVATGLGSDAGIENLGQALSFLQRTQPAAAGRITAAAAGSRTA
jgi:sugar/nucleoside kinase (ribokinase family)